MRRSEGPIALQISSTFKDIRVQASFTAADVDFNALQRYLQEEESGSIVIYCTS